MDRKILFKNTPDILILYMCVPKLHSQCPNNFMVGKYISKSHKSNPTVKYFNPNIKVARITCTCLYPLDAAVGSFFCPVSKECTVCVLLQGSCPHPMQTGQAPGCGSSSITDTHLLQPTLQNSQQGTKKHRHTNDCKNWLHWYRCTCTSLLCT